MILGVYPAIKFSEDENGFTCQMDVPGFKQSEIDLKYENGWVIICAVRNVNGKDEKINRTFYAPSKSINATVNNGVLIIKGEHAELNSDIKWH